MNRNNNYGNYILLIPNLYQDVKSRHTKYARYDSDYQSKFRAGSITKQNSSLIAVECSDERKQYHDDSSFEES